MKKQHRLMLLPLVIAFALLAVFVLTAPVQAQDEVPPPEAAPTEVISEAAPVPEVVPTDAPPEVIPTEIRQAETPDPEVLQTDAVQLEETLIEGSVEAPVVDPTAQDLAPALDAVADAGLVLADESGEPLTLVSEDTVQTLIGADPYYTTAAGKYMFILSPGSCPDPLPSGTVYCTVSTTPIQAAINYIPTSGLPSNGLIYVEAGAYSELPTINALGNPIYNGLKGLIGTVSDGVPQVNLAGDIFVNNVDLGFTIKGFNITATANLPFAGIYIIDSIGPVKIEDVAITNTGTGRGISIVNHNGSVTLTRVKSSGNTQNDGASIDNTAGSSGVTIGNSAFDDNFLDGLKIKTKGKVTIIGISASGNKGGDGVLISSLGGLDIRSSVFSDNTAEIGTDASGLKAYDNMKGNITLVDVLANNNEQHGIYLGTTTGIITATGLTAIGNLGFGTWLDTCYMNLGKCTTTGNGSVTINSSEFLDNDFEGLMIYARGNITANLANSSGNGRGGAAMINAFSPLSAPTTTITRSIFSENVSTGLEVWSRGTITLNNVSADNNISAGETSGAWLSTSGWPGSIYIYDTYGPNSFSGNEGILGEWGYGGHGLFASTWHKIVVNGTAADANSNDGLHLEEYYGADTITVHDSHANLNGNLGLNITSYGFININDSSFAGNTNSNALLDNIPDTSGAPGVTILRSQFNGEFDGMKITTGNGLKIISKGAITITDSRADSNGGIGASLDNSEGVAGVSIFYNSLSNHFDDNDSDGLVITTNGPVSVKGTIAMLNEGYGARIDNCNYYDEVCHGSGSVSIALSSFYTNGGYGLLVTSKGAISLTDTSARFNLGTGVYLANNWTGASAGISVIRMTSHSLLEFSNNKSSGMVIHTFGPVTVKDATVMENNGWGVMIENQRGAVILSNLAISDNNADGLSVQTLGSISITDSWSAYSGKNGAVLLNYFGSGTVTLKNSQFNLNAGTGLFIRSANSIIMTNVDAWSNEYYDAIYPGYGVDIDNTYGTAGVTLYAPKTDDPVDHNLFFDNASVGLHILTNGAISLARIDAHENTGDGVYLENDNLTYKKAVTVVDSLFSNNTHHGINILTVGILTFTGNSSAENATFGANLDNCALNITVCQSTAAVNIKNSYFNNNSGGGLTVLSGGSVLFDKVISNFSTNGSGAGIDISNSSLSTSAVTVLRSRFNDNRFDGLVVTGRGTITVNAIEANRNMGLEGMNPHGGLILDNYNFGTGAINILSTLGENIFNDNARYGIAAFSNSAIAASMVTSQRNGSFGLYLMGYTTSSNVIVTDGNLRMNVASGLYVSTFGTITLTRVRSLYNGYGTTLWDGVTLSSHGKAITINQSAMHGNAYYGIFANGGAASTVITVKQSSWFGNGPTTLSDIYKVGTLIIFP